MNNNAAADAVADAVFGAIERGDLEQLGRLWADDIEVWHSNDEVVQDKVHNLATIGWMIENTASVEYRDIVRDPTAEGFVQRHTLRLTHHDERTADLAVAIFLSISDGQVIRIDEYFDSARAKVAFGL